MQKPIRTIGDPVLRRKCTKVKRFDDGLSRLIADLKDTLTAHAGLGLAAPQIGAPLRVMALRRDPDRYHRSTRKSRQPRPTTLPASRVASRFRACRLQLCGRSGQ